MVEALDPGSRVTAKNQMVATMKIVPWHVVSISLTEEQTDALQEIMGERITELRVKVEELGDLADMIVN
jgi:hypothetical protein